MTRSMLRTLRHGFIVVAWCIGGAAVATQTKTIEWELDLDPSDKTAILTIAKDKGIVEVRKVSFAFMMPLGCGFVRVESSVNQFGNRVAWREVHVQPMRRNPCLEGPTNARQVERWFGADIFDHLAWRIKDGNWFLDVEAPGVPYNDAELIVRAIRRRRMINRVPKSAGADPLFNIKNLDASAISRIVKSGDATGEYEVYSGIHGGFHLTVRVVNGRVELLSLGHYIV